MSTEDQGMRLKPVRSKQQLKTMIIPTAKCPKHTEKYLEFLCLTHLEKCCETCCNLHASCQILPDTEVEAEANVLKQNFKTRLSTVQNKADILIKDIKEKRNLVEKNHAEMIKAVKDMRKDLNKTIDELEDDIKVEAEQLKVLEENTLGHVTKMIENFKKELKIISTVMKQTENLKTTRRLTDMVINIKSDNSMKRAEDILASAEQALNEEKIKCYTFMPNLDLKAALQKANGMGKFYPNILTEHQRDFSVKTKQDTVHAWITGSTAIPNKIIIADSGNYKIKVFDDKSFDLISELSLLSWPWAVTKVSKNMIATTVPLMKKIHIVKTDEGLSIDKDIATSNKCRGLAHWDGKFIVSYGKKDKIEIIDMSGNVIHSIKNEANGEKFIDFPEYVTLGPDNQTIFISNFIGNSILKYGLEGKMKGSYRDEELTQPRQTVFDKNGILYVSGYGSKNIHLMTSDLQKVKVLLASTEKWYMSRCVCLSDRGDKLFVDISPDSMRVFDVSSAMNSTE